MNVLMTKERALGHFIEHHVLHKWQEDIMIIDEVYQKQQEQIETHFVEVVGGLCLKAKKMQEEGRKNTVQSLYYSMLRTRMKTHQAHYRLDLYDEQWYLDEARCMATWDADFIFAPLFDRMRKLEVVRTEYARKVTAMDVERMMQLELPRYHGIAVEFIRSMVPKVWDVILGNGMALTTPFYIYGGEYRDQAELLDQR
ncbi:hypothetical protein D3C77_294200 [compost metagenome]